MKNNKQTTMTEYLEREYIGKAKDKNYYVKMEIVKETDAKLRMIGILYDDTERAMKESTKQLGDQYTHRTLVRTLFAHIEGELSLMKQTVILWHRLNAINLSPLELRKLVDIPMIFDNSQIAIKPLRIPLKDSLKFTFGLLGSIPGKSAINIDTKSPGWISFCKAITIRDNLMHPKVEENLIMTEQGMEQVILAWNWFKDISSQLLPNK